MANAPMVAIGHEQVLVEHLAVFDVAGCPQQHVVAGDEVGHEVQREQQVDRSGLAAKHIGQRQQVLGGEYDGEQGQRDQDAVAPLTLLFVHESDSLCRQLAPGLLNERCRSRARTCGQLFELRRRSGRTGRHRRRVMSFWVMKVTLASFTPSICLMPCFDLRSAVGAVELVEFERLTHDGSFRLVDVSNGIGRVPGYSQIWVMPCASMVYTWSSDRE